MPSPPPNRPSADADFAPLPAPATPSAIDPSIYVFGISPTSRGAFPVGGGLGCTPPLASSSAVPHVVGAAASGAGPLVYSAAVQVQPIDPSLPHAFQFAYSDNTGIDLHIPPLWCVLRNTKSAACRGLDKVAAMCYPFPLRWAIGGWMALWGYAVAVGVELDQTLLADDNPPAAAAERRRRLAQQRRRQSGRGGGGRAPAGRGGGGTGMNDEEDENVLMSLATSCIIFIATSVAGAVAGGGVLWRTRLVPLLRAVPLLPVVKGLVPVRFRVAALLTVVSGVGALIATISHRFVVRQLLRYRQWELEPTPPSPSSSGTAPLRCGGAARTRRGRGGGGGPAVACAVAARERYYFYWDPVALAAGQIAAACGGHEAAAAQQTDLPPRLHTRRSRLWARLLSIFIHTDIPRLQVYERCLPRRPVPSLEETVRGFLLAAEPLYFPCGAADGEDERVIQAIQPRQGSSVASGGADVDDRQPPPPPPPPLPLTLEGDGAERHTSVSSSFSMPAAAAATARSSRVPYLTVSLARQWLRGGGTAEDPPGALVGAEERAPVESGWVGSEWRQLCRLAAEFLHRDGPWLQEQLCTLQSAAWWHFIPAYVFSFLRRRRCDSGGEDRSRRRDLHRTSTGDEACFSAGSFSAGARAVTAASYQDRNYLDSWWQRAVHLAGRQPLPFSSDYVVAIERCYNSTTTTTTAGPSAPTCGNGIARAAVLTYLLGQLERDLARDRLPPVCRPVTNAKVSGGAAGKPGKGAAAVPVSVAALLRAFYTTRLPGREVDRLEQHPPEEVPPPAGGGRDAYPTRRYAIVLYKGCLYQLFLERPDGASAVPAGGGAPHVEGGEGPLHLLRPTQEEEEEAYDNDPTGKSPYSRRRRQTSSIMRANRAMMEGDEPTGLSALLWRRRRRRLVPCTPRMLERALRWIVEDVEVDVRELQQSEAALAAATAAEAGGVPYFPSAFDAAPSWLMDHDPCDVNHRPTGPHADVLSRTGTPSEGRCACSCHRTPAQQRAGDGAGSVSSASSSGSPASPPLRVDTMAGGAAPMVLPLPPQPCELLHPESPFASFLLPSNDPLANARDVAYQRCERLLPALTCTPRAQWADTRQQFFAQDPVNHFPLKVVEQAMFVISLADDVLTREAKKEAAAAAAITREKAHHCPQCRCERAASATGAGSTPTPTRPTAVPHKNRTSGAAAPPAGEDDGAGLRETEARISLPSLPSTSSASAVAPVPQTATPAGAATRGTRTNPAGIVEEKLKHQTDQRTPAAAAAARRGAEQETVALPQLSLSPGSSAAELSWTSNSSHEQRPAPATSASDDAAAEAAARRSGFSKYQPLHSEPLGRCSDHGAGTGGGRGGSKAYRDIGPAVSAPPDEEGILLIPSAPPELDDDAHGVAHMTTNCLDQHRRHHRKRQEEHHHQQQQHPPPPPPGVSAGTFPSLWADKSFHLLVAGDGSAGFHVEGSWCDPSAFQWLVDYITMMERVPDTTPGGRYQSRYYTAEDGRAAELAEDRDAQGNAIRRWNRAAQQRRGAAAGHSRGGRGQRGRVVVGPLHGDASALVQQLTPCRLIFRLQMPLVAAVEQAYQLYGRFAHDSIFSLPQPGPRGWPMEEGGAAGVEAKEPPAAKTPTPTPPRAGAEAAPSCFCSPSPPPPLAAVPPPVCVSSRRVACYGRRFIAKSFQLACRILQREEQQQQQHAAVSPSLFFFASAAGDATPPAAAWWQRPPAPLSPPGPHDVPVRAVGVPEPASWVLLAIHLAQLDWSASVWPAAPHRRGPLLRPGSRSPVPPPVAAVAQVCETIPVLRYRHAGAETVRCLSLEVTQCMDALRNYFHSERGGGAEADHNQELRSPPPPPAAPGTGGGLADRRAAVAPQKPAWLLLLMLRACASHTHKRRLARQGRGTERHLLGLFLVSGLCQQPSAFLSRAVRHLRWKVHVREHCPALATLRCFQEDSSSSSDEEDNDNDNAEGRGAAPAGSPFPRCMPTAGGLAVNPLSDDGVGVTFCLQPGRRSGWRRQLQTNASADPFAIPLRSSLEEDEEGCEVDMEHIDLVVTSYRRTFTTGGGAGGLPHHSEEGLNTTDSAVLFADRVAYWLDRMEEVVRRVRISEMCREGGVSETAARGPN